jgi:peroxiredoxin
MTDRAKLRLVAAAIGAVIAVAVVALGFWLGGAFEESNATDGSFVLDQPGIFDQPADDVNADTAGSGLPDTVLTDADGAEHRLTDLEGRPAVVNFWFSRCVPCRRELVDFATVDAEVGDRVRFVGVDPFDTVDAMQHFADERGVTYDLWRDPDQQLVDELGLTAFPVTLFVDAGGTVVHQTGEIDADELRAKIDELFGEDV